MSRVLDYIAKGLAAATTRRDMLKALTGAVLFGFTGCRPEKQCRAFCSSTLGCRCAALSQCMAVCEACPTSYYLCSSPACGSVACCPTGDDYCNGACSNPTSDANNCGGCAAVATAGTCYSYNGSSYSSVSSTTGTQCSTLHYASPACCNGRCLDLSSIGTCGTNCASTTACTGTTPTCCSGTCVDLFSNTTCGPSCDSYANCGTGAVCCGRGPYPRACCPTATHICSGGIFCFPL